MFSTNAHIEDLQRQSGVFDKSDEPDADLCEGCDRPQAMCICKPER